MRDGAAVGVAAGVGESGAGVGVGAGSEPPQVAATASEAQEISPAAVRITDFRTAISLTLHRWDPVGASYIDGMRFVDGNFLPGTRENRALGRARADENYSL